MNLAHVTGAASALLVASLAFTACSSTDASTTATPTGPDAGATDAGATEDAADAAPAVPQPAAPQVPTQGGPVLASPHLVVATFAGEALAPQLEAFAKGIGASSYWKAVTSEYGVGPASFARSVAISDAAPATLEQGAVETWLAGQLDGTHAEWGTPDPSAIYTVLYPKTTTLTIGGQSACNSSPAWHGEIKAAGGVTVAYAAMMRCDPFLGLDGIDFVSAGLSHEWLEAATNPHWLTNPAYGSEAGPDAEWGAVTGGELGDLCTLSPTVYIKPDDLPFMVQRSWSNASAAAGHDPCVPRPADPYFLSAPASPEKVATGGYISSDWVHGIVIPAGGSRTVDVHLFADGPTSGPWTVKATDYAAAFGSTKDLAFTWDKTSGKAGDTLHLTIKRLKKDDAIGGAAVFTLTSTLGKRESAWVVAVGDAAK